MYSSLKFNCLSKLVGFLVYEYLRMTVKTCGRAAPMHIMPSHFQSHPVSRLFATPFFISGFIRELHHYVPLHFSAQKLCRFVHYKASWRKKMKGQRNGIMLTIAILLLGPVMGTRAASSGKMTTSTDDDSKYNRRWVVNQFQYALHDLVSRL